MTITANTSTKILNFPFQFFGSTNFMVYFMGGYGVLTAAEETLYFHSVDWSSIPFLSVKGKFSSIIKETQKILCLEMSSVNKDFIHNEFWVRYRVFRHLNH